ncbi:MAG TPA: host-nuclease inhibitor Gam family protein [Candidatus Acidoferrum sp.]|nr:host-nuclease inhibitor Gam family protein [Candidatus Acidoferrum sp.]
MPKTNSKFKIPDSGRDPDSKRPLKNWDEAKAAMEVYRRRDVAERELRVVMDAQIERATAVYTKAAGPVRASIEALRESLEAFAWGRKKEFLSTESGGPGRTRVHDLVEVGFEMGKAYVDIPEQFEAGALAWLEQEFKDRFVKRAPKIMLAVLSAALKKAEEDRDKRFIARMKARKISRRQDDGFVLKVLEVETIG